MLCHYSFRLTAAAAVLTGPGLNMDLSQLLRSCAGELSLFLRQNRYTRVDQTGAAPAETSPALFCQ